MRQFRFLRARRPAKPARAHRSGLNRERHSTRAAVRLRDEYAAADRAELFEELRGFRLDAPEPRAYAEVSARLGLSESAVKSAIRRFRQRHHQLVREQIAQTVSDPEEVNEEIRYLLRVLA